MSVIEAPAVTEPLAEPFCVPVYDEYETAALNYINRIRAAFGFGPLEALPRGERGSGRDCVVARGITLGNDLRIRQGAFNTRELRCNEPSKIVGVTDGRTATFITKFDKGMYPQYEEKV